MTRNHIAGLIAQLDQTRVALLAVLDTVEPDDPETTARRRAVLERETCPHARELDTYAELAAQGLTNREIAERMRVHRRTAEKYGRRLQATSRKVIRG